MVVRRRVLLVEDDAQYVAALRLVVDPHLELDVCGSVEALRQARGPWDVACVDLGLPDGDGIDVVRGLVEQHPELPVIVVTVQRADRKILGAVRAGARGYLLKEHAGARLESAIEEAIAGGAPMSSVVARRLLSLVAALPAIEVRERPQPQLTDRELSVVRTFSEGQSYQQAAATLGISLNTLRTHVRSVYEKLAVGTRTEAVLSALELGLLSKR
jgi:DNA-binding NarL/FixJ family response regulator